MMPAETMRQKIKIEAPVRDLRSAKIAISSGADILYGGIRGWSVRPHIFEMGQDEFLKVIKLAKSHQKEILLTMNCFYRSAEIPRALSIIEKMVNAGLSGVIVSQFGLLKEIKERFPNLSVHISVLASASNTTDLELYRALGVDNVTLPRNSVDTSLENIRKFSCKGVGLGVFIIGDDIHNYDGRCYLSSYLNQKLIKDDTGRDFCAMGSANKSSFCFIMCKRKSEFIEDSELRGYDFYLRRQDLVLFTKTRELIKHGVSFFKIQGREFPTSLTGAFIKTVKDLSGCLENEVKYVKLVNKLVRLTRIKQQIQANHLWLLAKSKSKFWAKIRKYFQEPWDSLEVAFCLYIPFFGNLRWKKL